MRTTIDHAIYARALVLDNIRSVVEAGLGDMADLACARLYQVVIVIDAVLNHSTEVSITLLAHVNRVVRAHLVDGGFMVVALLIH